MTVLLVEEEDRLASLVTKGLGARGFVVRRIASGAQAESTVAREIDIVVLDLRLPTSMGSRYSAGSGREGCTSRS